MLQPSREFAILTTSTKIPQLLSAEYNENRLTHSRIIQSIWALLALAIDEATKHCKALNILQKKEKKST